MAHTLIASGWTPPLLYAKRCELMGDERSDIVGMITLKQFIAGLDTIPVTTSWYLADTSEAKGRQELCKRQSPQRLKSLKEYGL